jgi:hypothetical protein
MVLPFSLPGEYLEDRGLDRLAWELALTGLETFPKSESFYVDVKDSKRVCSVSVSPSRASVSLFGEYSEDRGLDGIAWEFARTGLETFPESKSFFVEVKDSKRQGRALVRRDGAVTLG